MAKFDPRYFDAMYFDTAQIAVTALPLPPPLPPFIERHFTATIPITVNIRQPIQAIMPMQANVRILITASVTMTRNIRKQITISFIVEKLVMTPQFETKFKRELERTRRKLEMEAYIT